MERLSLVVPETTVPVRSVAFDVPPPGVVVTLRDLELTHVSVKIAVPNTWGALLDRVNLKLGSAGLPLRLYYSTTGLQPVKKKLFCEADFVDYAETLVTDGQLPDIWVLRADSAHFPSPEILPDASAPRSGSGSVTSSRRSSAQQSDFRNALLLRDAASGGDVHCALCGSVSALQAAHIIPQRRPDQFTSEDGGLSSAMAAAGLVTVYDPRNGFLLCDQCHDFFDAYLWTVDAEQKVVLSNALVSNVPSLAGCAGRQLFPEDATASIAYVANRPMPSVWAWHYQTFIKTTEVRHAKKVTMKMFDCRKCRRRYVKSGSRDAHEATCTAARVPAANFFTPEKAGGKAQTGAGSGRKHGGAKKKKKR